MTTRPLIVGITLAGEDLLDPAALIRRTRAAERLGLGLLHFDEGRAGRWRPDPLESAALAAAVTDAVGLLVTAATTHVEPFHLSNRLSSLDWGSRGRAGWLATIDVGAERAAAYSATVPDTSAARREAAEVLDAVVRLWDSWEDSALIADAANGRFLDADKLHYVDAGGEFFTVRGPALMPRPVQGRPVIFSSPADGLPADVSVICEVGAAGELTLLRIPAAQVARLAEFAGVVDAVLVDGPSADAALVALERVVPDLLADGTLVRPQPGQTLREQFGLCRPASVYASTVGASR